MVLKFSVASLTFNFIINKHASLREMYRKGTNLGNELYLKGISDSVGNAWRPFSNAYWLVDTLWEMRK
jgi:hypothetical protein